MTDSRSDERGGAQPETPAGNSAPGAVPAKFVTGSTMRHVAVMTASSSIGLMAIFSVDFLNLFYISLLGKQELAAAIGYAGAILAFNIAIGVGMAIATGALVSRALGAGDRDKAKRMAGSAMIFMLGISSVIALALWPAIPWALGRLGASGETADIAAGFLQIVVPSMPLIALGMGLSAVLRAVGDAKRAMYVTLGAGLASAVLDPIFIFGFDLGVTGAAIATVLSRLVLVILSWHGAHRVHAMIGRIDPAGFTTDVRALGVIAVPAMLTNVATPVGNAYVTGELAGFGDNAVAGWAIISRIIPVAFGTLFSLSGAVGPIIGQNFGAGNMDRVRRTLRDALVFALGCSMAAWLVLLIFRGGIADLFGAVGEAGELIEFFCLFVAGTYVFSGALYVANASFNNLGFPTYSTLFNWGRATVGTIPLVWLGAKWAGPTGALAGWAIGGVVFGIAAVIVAFRVTSKLEPDDAPPRPSGPPLDLPVLSPLSSGKHTLS